MPFKKIGVRLTVAVAATALVVISAFAWVNIRSHRAAMEAEMERHADQLGEAVKSGTEYDMLLNQRERIHQSIRRMADQPGIRRIRVMNQSGRVIYSSDAAEIGQLVDKNAESCYRCHQSGIPLQRLATKERTRIFRQGGERVLGIINPIYNKPSCWTAACHVHSKSQVVLGVLDVTMPLGEVDRGIRRGQIEIAVFALTAILALSLIVSLFVKRWVDGPVEDLLTATRHVAGGDLDYVIAEGREDELGMLARSFNRMTRKLSEARQQLFQSEKLASLGRLAAGIAHEINNPLTGVLTYGSYLLKRTQDRPEIQEDLKVIVRETIRSREIIKSLLDFARQSVPKKAETDLNEIIERALVVTENHLAVNHIRLEKVLDPSLPKPVADANQMQQVFVNLLVNAADAIGTKGGTITVASAGRRLPLKGSTQIKRAVCPKGHSLMEEAPWEAKASIRLKAVCGGREALVRLDPHYGRNAVLQGEAYDASGEVRILCLECSSSLMAPIRCPQCKAAVYTFEVPAKGMVEGCVRPACGWQRWEAVDSAGEKEFVEVSVKDTGCGIPKDQMSKIFEPFYSTKGQKGTGLGLSVIWGIVDNHDGDIAVESEVGVGTTFVVRIPVRS